MKLLGVLSFKDIWTLTQQILPFYILLLIGYFLTKQNIIQNVHIAGISHLLNIAGVPAFVFHLIAFNNPYNISLKLIAADGLQKVFALILSGLWWRFSKRGSIDGCISFFMLATLPNLVLVGNPALTPLFGKHIDVPAQVGALIFEHTLVWFNVVIFLYELRKDLLELKRTKSASPSLSTVPSNSATNHIANARQESLHRCTILSSTEIPNGNAGNGDKQAYPLPDPLLHGHPMPSFSFPTSVPAEGEAVQIGRLRHPAGDSDHWVDIDEHLIGERDSPAAVEKGESNAGSGDPESDGYLSALSKVVEDSPGPIVSPQASIQRLQSAPNNKIDYVSLMVKVLKRMFLVPLTISTMLGFAYSMLASHFHFKMPYPIKASLELVSGGAIGVALFVLGISWAKSGRIISCGYPKMVYNFTVRFLVGPAIMVAACLSTHTRGPLIGFAVVQVAIPQSIFSFVLAKEYNCDSDLFCSASIFQFLVFIPIIIAWYLIIRSLY